MAKKINFTYEGKDYCLEYTRKSIKQMEDEGFNISEINEKPMTILPAMFAGAFKVNHKFLKKDVIDEIYRHMPDKEKLIERLAEMYNEPLIALMDEPDDNDAKKVEWTASW